jgi:outer membrane protein OmpA-like peptidoglycan-associated protein
MKTQNILFGIGIITFIIACGNSSEKKKEINPQVEEGIKKTNVDEDTDLFADIEEDGWEMDDETKDGMEKLEAFLEGIENFSTEMNYEMLLNKKQVSRAEFKTTIEAITKERLARSQPTNAKEEAAAYAADIQKRMQQAGIGMTLKEAEDLVAAYNASEDQKLTSKYNGAETEKEINSVLQKNLGKRDAGFIEENLNKYQAKTNEKRLQTLRKLAASTSEKETRTILREHYEITDKELLLLEKFPKLLENLPSEKVAIASGEYKLPEAVSKHLASANASPRFKEIIAETLQKKKEISKQFLTEAAKARKQFYKDNPNWIKNEYGADNTYIDERQNFVFLPLGDLSFADVIVSKKLGRSGANSNGIIGPPDMSTKRFYEVDEKICNLGLKGQITLAFTDNSLSNVIGPDLYIFEMGAIEPTNLEISKNGFDWISVGKIEGGTAMVDIEPFVKAGDTFNYVRLTDLETESGIPGADIDAVAAIGGAMLLSMDSAVLFDSGSYNLKESATKELQKLATKIKVFPKGNITINGHTDNDGSNASNLKLSENRAKSVSTVLKKLLGNIYNFEIKGYGASNPIAPNTTKENKQKNRRVEILIVPTNKH